MGHHIVLLRRPPRAIGWKQLSSAARKPGWETDEATNMFRMAVPAIPAVLLVIRFTKG
jgi:hypothetical protein